MRVKLSVLASIAAAAMGLVIVAIAYISPSLLAQYAAMLSFVLLLLVLGVMYALFEDSNITSKEVALIGILAAITAASRIPFAALPNIKPCTFLIIVTGLVFGSLAGAMVGSLTAAVSNMFFGQGPWTPWEMFAWATVGVIAGWVGKRYPNAGVRDVILLGIVLGMTYNTIMDFYSWITMYRADLNMLLPTLGLGLPFGALHIAVNVIFAVILGKPVLALFRRFQQRFHVSYTAPDPNRLVPEKG